MLNEILRLLKRDRRIFLFATILLILGFFYGEYVYCYQPDIAHTYIKEITKFLKQMTHPNGLMQILIIWTNNVKAAIMALFVGILFPFVPAFVLLSNGFIIGLMQKVLEAKINPISFFLTLSPHGILELPAIIIAAGVGMRLGGLLYLWIWHKIKGDSYQSPFVERFKEIRYYGVLIVVMLFCAATIEVTISPLLFKVLRLTH